jgi:hypothetical protein
LALENVAPEFTSQPNPLALTAGDKFLYRATATDLNADDLTYSNSQAGEVHL